jgi:hypothetical protein
MSFNKQLVDKNKYCTESHSRSIHI